MSDITHPVSPAQAERLDILAEEAAEVIVAVSKIKRHGWQHMGHHNRIGLEHELGDLLWALRRLAHNDDLSLSAVERFAHEKPGKAAPFLHQQEEA